MMERDVASDCSNANLYYYDFIDNNNHGNTVPESVVQHIMNCEYCRKEIELLRQVIAVPRYCIDNKTEQNIAALTGILKLHFVYLAKPITCSNIRPFLAMLAEPSFQVAVETPVTAHVDNCPECQDDLKAIAGLNLSYKQLYSLTRLLAYKPEKNPLSCFDAEQFLPPFVKMEFSESTLETLRHICVCSQCRNRIYHYRQTRINNLCSEPQNPESYPCDSVSYSDLFEYCFPYGINPSNDHYAKFRPAFTSHVSNCSRCLAKMQHLHKVITSVMERPESDVVTCFTFSEQQSESDDESGNKPNDDLYFRNHGNVEVYKKCELVGKDLLLSTSHTQKLTTGGPARLLKPVAIAAVIILIAALFLYTTPAKAVTLEQVYEAIAKVSNVLLRSFTHNEQAPRQEIWVSRSMNIKLTKTKDKIVLFDTATALQRIKNITGISSEERVMNDDLLQKTKESINTSLGIMPFEDIRKVPSDAQWKKVDMADSADIEVYDLCWVEEQGIKILRYKWRCFIDVRTNLPEKVEIYWKTNNSTNYEMIMYMSISYPADNEIRGVINSVFEKP